MTDEPIELEDALKQMKEQGNIPDGFHMMFFSEEFGSRESCPTNQLLKSIGERFGFANNVRRQVFSMPKNQTIISYEFACYVSFDDLQQTLEEVDSLINDSFKRMLNDGTLTSRPKARVQFILKAPQEAETDEF